MRYGRIAGLDHPVSRVVLGTAGFGDHPSPDEILDEYVLAGGNCLDTAWIYGQEGSAERTVGSWLGARGTRKDIVLIAKGACSTDCTPDMIVADLDESFERLGVDTADIYMMHRDNPAVPAGEFVDLLNQQVDAGRIRVFGGSNWSTARLAEANEYARANGLRGFTVSSPNLSLARWNEPTWEDTLTASDPGSRRWYRENDVALFAWSSQANGFFTGRYGRSDADDPALADVARVWFNDENFLRRQRAEAIASRRGVEATHIALAYVLNQPFETYALIGPLTVEEVRSSLGGADIELSEDELRELDLGKD